MHISGSAESLEVRTVIYATDFSRCCVNAGSYAALIAAHLHVDLVVTHAFTPTQAAMEVESDPEQISRQRKDLEIRLADNAALLASEETHTNSVLLEGDPRTVVPEFAEQSPPALIVLGTHGGGWMRRSVIGSVAEQILRSTPWPTLTVGPEVTPAPTPPSPFRRILYATDLTAAGANAARYTLFFAKAFGAEIDVLNVVEEGAIDHADRMAKITQEFYRSLDAVVPEKAGEFGNPRTFVEIGEAHETILRHIQERTIDLLVLGIRKTSHLGLTMRTSGAFQLIVDAPCPVMTVTG